MGVEIERRFLVTDASVVQHHEGMPIVQGYLAKDKGGMSTRIRIFRNQGWVTLKSSRRGISRDEFEYPIPTEDARFMIEHHCIGRIIRKTRFLIPHAHHVFEVDVFGGPLAGLIIAEVELARADEPVVMPAWLGLEVSRDRRYGNRRLAEFGLPAASAAPAPPHIPAPRLRTPDLASLFRAGLAKF